MFLLKDDKLYEIMFVTEINGDRHFFDNEVANLDDYRIYSVGYCNESGDTSYVFSECDSFKVISSATISFTVKANFSEITVTKDVKDIRKNIIELDDFAINKNKKTYNIVEFDVIFKSNCDGLNSNDNDDGDYINDDDDLDDYMDDADDDIIDDTTNDTDDSDTTDYAFKSFKVKAIDVRGRKYITLNNDYAVIDSDPENFMIVDDRGVAIWTAKNRFILVGSDSKKINKIKDIIDA